LQDWEKSVDNKKAGQNIIETNLDDYENYFDNQNSKINEKKKAELAEKERIKGN
jgi:hypothetical protein